MQLQKKDNLIITADDFGVSKIANQKILKVVQNQKIDRVAIMIGGKFSSEEIKKLLATGIKLDIHLHLLSRDFFQKRKEEPKGGAIKRGLVFLKDFLIGKYSSQKVKLIWEKQIKYFFQLFGQYPDGINSHEHMHFFPPFFRVALSLKNKYKVDYIRLGKKGSDLKFIPVAFILNVLRKINLKFNSIANLKTSDYLISFDWLTMTKNFSKQFPKKGKTELVFHPERKEEYDFLEKNF